MREHQQQSGQEFSGHRERNSIQKLSGLGAAEVQRYLRGVDYPADKKQLLAQARGKDAPEDVLEMIQQFPDQDYNSAVHVSQMLDRIHH